MCGILSWGIGVLAYLYQSLNVDWKSETLKAAYERLSCYMERIYYVCKYWLSLETLQLLTTRDIE